MKTTNKLSILAISLLMLSGCNSTPKQSWDHYIENLPGFLHSIDYGNREYWQSENKVVFTKPDGNIVEQTMSKDIIASFTENDPRKILNNTSETVVYGIKNDLYGYDANSKIKGYKAIDGVIEKEGSEVNKVLVKDDTVPATYVNFLTATAVIDKEETFNEYCWANDHDVIGYYVLGNDINFLKTKTSSATSPQTTFSFLGTFDGMYHTINTVSVSNNVLGMFGCSIHGKTVDGVKYSPSIKNLTISNVEGKNRIFGESIENFRMTQLNVSQGNGEPSEEGLLAKNLGKNNTFTKCKFTFNDLVENPCLFVDQPGTGSTFTGTNILYLKANTRIVKNDENSGPNGTYTGLNWKTVGDISLAILGGKAINAIGTEPYEYLQIVDDPETKNNEIAEYLYPRKTHSYFEPLPVEIKWSASTSVQYPLLVKIANDKAMTDIIKTYTVQNKSTNNIDVYNLVPNQEYYYQVVDSSATPKTSIVDSFSFNSPLRVIDCQGRTTNMRDLGGWQTNDGKHIKYGLVFRSASWEGMDPIGAEILENDLGMKTEIDVRLSKDEREHSCTQFEYINCGLTDAYPNMLTHSDTIKNITKLFNEVLTDENNYPLTYHCSIGSDRTGFCSLLIEGCLDVIDEDIYRDYELSTFYKTDRTRADIKVDQEGNYYFREDGGRSDFWNEGGFKKLIEQNLKNYYTASGKISDAIVNFLTTKCSVTNKSIQTIRDLLIEK